MTTSKKDKIAVAKMLLSSLTYREFLLQLINDRSLMDTISYASLSRKAGFSSRAFVRDVVLGKRRITAKTLPSFVKGLELTGDLKSYFIMLVAQEESDVLTERLRPEAIQSKKLKLKERLSEFVSVDSLKNSSKSNFPQVDRWMEVYSALGTPEDGASLEKISDKTGMDRDLVIGILRAMIQTEVATFNEQRKLYFASNLHLVFKDMGRVEFFQKSFLSYLNRVAKKATTDFSDPGALFLSSVFSISKKNWPILREQMRELIVNFSDQSEDANGDSIAKIVVGFTES